MLSEKAKHTLPTPYPMANPVDHLFFRAKLDPTAIAIQDMDRLITFGQLSILVKDIANKLRQSGIRPGQVVVTAIPDKYFDWIFTLALLHEATISCSNCQYLPIDSSLEYDWVITDRSVEHFAPEKTIQINQDWVRDAQNHSQDIEYVGYRTADDLVRINLTSGTTGRVKPVALTAEQIVERARNSLQSISPYSRFLCMLPLSAALGTNNALACLLRGAPLFCAHSVEGILRSIEMFSIKGVHGSVAQIATLSEACARQGRRVKSLKTVIYAGAPASPQFVEKVSKWLAGDIYNDYGSTETAGIGSLKLTIQTGPAACCYLFPDVSLEVVDENFKTLEPGEEGLIRVKRPYMVQQYYKNPEATNKFFKDGWFYPGDRGRLSKDGLLFLTGRDSEVINRGGVKIDPALIDQFLVAFPGIQDAAAFGLENQTGMQVIAAAIVSNEQFDAETLRQALLKKFGEVSPTRFFSVKQIPRNQMGKVMRSQMSKAFADPGGRNESL